MLGSVVGSGSMVALGKEDSVAGNAVQEIKQRGVEKSPYPTFGMSALNRT